MLRTLSFFLALVALGLTEKATFENHRVYRLLPQTQEQVDLLHKMEDSVGFSFWKGPSYVNKSADLMVAPSNLAEFTELMTLNGLKYEVYVDNVQRLIDTENPKTRSITKDGSVSLNEYHTLDEIYSYLEYLAKNYEEVEVVDAGRTSEGRVIKGVKISYQEGNPGIFIEAGIHAREWITPATALYLLDQLLNSTDKNIRALAEKHDWYIFPSYNPDGYVYTHSKNRMWRKTRSHKNTFCAGADANRNWDFKWMSGGASNYPCAETYAGSSAFSEPETKSMAKYIQSVGTKLFAYISFHSYSQLLMFPYGHTSAHLDNYNEELSIGKKTIEALRQRYGTKYVTGNIAETIYVASGSSSDWVKATLKLPVVFTYEFRDTGRYGFLLPADQIIPNGEEIVDSLLAMFQEASRLGYPNTA